MQFVLSHRQEDRWMAIGLFSPACLWHLPLLPCHHPAWPQTDDLQRTSQHQGDSYYLQFCHGVPFRLHVL